MQNFNVIIRDPAVIGMDDRTPSHELPVGVYQLLDNVLFADNKLVKRPGSTGSTAIAGGKSILGGSAFEPAGGTKRQVICYNGASNAQLYQSTDGATFSAIGSANLTAGAAMNFVQASNYIFGFNGTDAVDYDGTTVTKNRASVPLGKFGFWFHNYLFVSGVTGNPNRLYWSNLSDPTTFAGANYVDINANDGDSITGLSGFNDELVVMKNNSMWSITGWSGSSFSSTTIAGQNTNNRFYGYGSPSHQSIVAAGAYLYYLSFAGGVPHIRKVERTLYGVIRDSGIVSYEMEGTLKGLNLSSLSMASGVYDGKYIYWSLPNGSSTYNNLVLVYWPEHAVRTSLGTTERWAKWSSGITAAQWMISTISGRSKIYWLDGNNSGKVFLLDSSVFTDNGTAITSEIRSRDIVGDQAKKTHWKYMYIKYDTGSAGTLNVNARIDQAVAFGTQNQDISLTGSSPGLGPTGTFTLGVSVLGGSSTSKSRVTFGQLVGTMLGVQLKEATSHGMTIYDIEYYGNTKGLRAD